MIRRASPNSRLREPLNWDDAATLCLSVLLVLLLLVAPVAAQSATKAPLLDARPEAVYQRDDTADRLTSRASR